MNSWQLTGCCIVIYNDYDWQHCMCKITIKLVWDMKQNLREIYQYLSVNYTGGKTLTLQIWSIHQIQIRHGIV